MHDVAFCVTCAGVSASTTFSSPTRNPLSTPLPAGVQYTTVPFASAGAMIIVTSAALFDGPIKRALVERTDTVSSHSLSTCELTAFHRSRGMYQVGLVV